MRIITDSNALFSVEINPWLREITVEHIPGFRKLHYKYTELDEWFGWVVDGYDYDFHLLYDDELDFSIYRVVDGFSSSIPYNLDIAVLGEK